MRKIALAGAVVVAAALVGATPAAATVSPHCQDGGYCLFSGTNFTGTKAVLPTTRGCRAVSTLGFTPARSAARGYGDGYALELYSDTSCTTSVATVFDEVPDTNARSYALIPIPG
ncbi:peptidase inhibitor family I36 protein [Saccharothrix variisporea]|uniref:Peptidase inhibitor family I36 n=1 Tax=Saccharothrix variisporea TaxID=543527 RepID=A0A495XF22_9PSEU|nr:peptidase inhibitor family I36 protein [Saccharothrix variisporea]RKT72622.1 peptidase inhibitor family I36 [Saccharothrix variisporea]